MEPKYNVCFNKFSEHFQQMLQELYREEKYHDITLLSDDQTQFRVHRFVLSAFSPLLKKLIDNAQNQNLLIFLRGIQKDELKSILEFMYLGEAKFSLDKMSRFIQAAKDLELAEIADGLELPKAELAKDATEELVKSKDLEEATENETDTREDIPAEASEVPQDDDGLVSSPQTGVKLELEVRGCEEISRNKKKYKYKKTKQCPECSAMFRFNSGMIRHLKIQHRGQRFHCEECDFETKNSDHLKQHKENKHMGIRYPCDQCDYQATFKEGLKVHVKRKHEFVRYYCDQCDYSGQRRDRLDIHIEKVHNDGVREEKKEKIVKPPVPCPDCDKVFDSQFRMRGHYRSKHEGIRYPCDLCDYKATEKGSLKTHVKRVHEGLRYPCNHCEHKSSSKENLQRHVESVHEGVKHYCDQCDFKATTIQDVKIHVKTIHEGLRYPCKLCDYEAKLVGNLKAHIRNVHDGIRFYCDQCGFKTTRRGYLRAHMNSQHEVPPV